MALPTSSTLGSPISLASAYLEVEGSAIADGSDITDTLIALADASTDGTLYFQVPSSAMTLYCAPIAFSDYGITKFGCLESASAVTIQQTGTASAFWTFSTPAGVNKTQHLVFGTTTQKTNRADYKLTLSGSWTWTNRVLYPTDTGMIICHWASGTPETDWYYYCHTKYPNGQSFRIYDYQKAGITHHASGMWMHGCLFGYTTTVSCDDLYLYDPLGYGFGWLGAADGICDQETMGNQRVTGFSSVVTNTIRGSITVEYGNANFGCVALGNYLGDSETSPLEYTQKSFGWSGPNDLGKPAGVMLHKDHTLLGLKIDGCGDYPVDFNHRFIKFTVDDSDYGPTTEAPFRRIWLESSQTDDNPAGAAETCTAIVWTLVNLTGSVDPAFVGTQAYDVTGWMTYRGDGINPAMGSNSSVVLQYYDALEYAKVNNAEINDFNVVSANFEDGSHNTLTNVVLTGKLTVWTGALADNNATNLKFIGTTREIINVAAGSALDITNLRAPSGSTIVVGTSATVRIRKLTSDSWTILATGTITLTNGDLYYDPAANFPLTASDVPVTPSLSFLGVPSHPISDVVTGNWKSIPSGSLWSALDEETESDTDYIYTSQISDVCEIALNDVPNPEVYTYHRLSYRGIGPYTVEFRQNGTTIASWNENDSVMTTHVRFLTEAQAENITSDYTGFTVRITSN